MDLTTIKIPGKNNRVNSKKAIAERKALKRPRGRPLKLPTNDAVSQTTVASAQLIKKTKKRTLKNIKSRRKMSFLEKLPTELLFQVFLHCMNLELARASPVMAGKLSSEIVYLHTILSAFSPTWDRWHGREKFTGLKGNEEDRSLGTSEGDPKLQSAILRCRWVTVSRLLAAKDTWIQKNGQDRVFTPEYFMKSQNEDDTPSKLSATEYFNNDFASFSEFMQERDGGSIWLSCNWGVNKDLAQGVEVPTSLLLGPWTLENIKFLYWLIKAGARIDWLNSTSGEVALEGLKAAITRGQTSAIHLLQWAGLIEKLDIETLIWTFRNAGGDKISTVNQALRIGFSYLSTNLKDLRKVQRELADIQDEAEQLQDVDQANFVKGIKQSQTLSGLW